MNATIYHNPNCQTSRNVLATLRERGIDARLATAYGAAIAGNAEGGK